MKINPFRGSGVALATPFTEAGDIDREALRKMVSNVLQNGIDFICVLGTTAETPTLSHEEQLEVRHIIKEEVKGRVPLLLGAGGNNTFEVCDRLHHDDLEGFSGLLMVCPFYNKPTQHGLIAHFRAISEASPLPIVLYNIPERTGVNLLAETTLQLARECENIVAIKEASGKLEQIEQILSGAPEGFDVISGDDNLTLTMIRQGAVGVISVINNALPLEYSRLVHAALREDWAEAQHLQEQLAEMYKLLTVEGNPSGIKALLSLRGLAFNVLRLPLVPVSDATIRAMRHYCDTHHIPLI